MFIKNLFFAKKCEWIIDSWEGRDFFTIYVYIAKMPKNGKIAKVSEQCFTF